MEFRCVNCSIAVGFNPGAVLFMAVMSSSRTVIHRGSRLTRAGTTSYYLGGRAVPVASALQSNIVGLKTL